MSKIESQIKELKLKLKKIEFLEHILNSAKEYDHKDFKDVKEDVVSLLEVFITNAISRIESGETRKAAPVNNAVFNDSEQPVKVEQTPAQKESVESKDINAIASFAFDNRELSGKTVSVANDQNMEVKGEVVGLEYPHVLVKTTAGPIIKVPLEKVSPL